MKNNLGLFRYPHFVKLSVKKIIFLSLFGPIYLILREVFIKVFESLMIFFIVVKLFYKVLSHILLYPISNL